MRAKAERGPQPLHEDDDDDGRTDRNGGAGEESSMHENSSSSEESSEATTRDQNFITPVSAVNRSLDVGVVCSYKDGYDEKE